MLRRLHGLACVLAVPLLLGACGTDSDDGDTDDTSVKDGVESLYADSGLLWPNHTIDVCWENPSGNNERERQIVRDAVNSTWGAVSSLDFVGWGQCSQDSRGIRIKAGDDNEWPHTKGLGTQLDGARDGMVLRFNIGCGGPSQDACTRDVAVHEFGHALGFPHEQDRGDTSADCLHELGDYTPPRGGDIALEGWDKLSVMNYCRPGGERDGHLTQSDIDGVRLVYDAGLSGLVLSGFSDKCLDVVGYSVDNGAPLSVYLCHGGPNQRFRIEKQGDGYRFVGQQSNKCMDVDGVSKNEGARIIQWDCHGGDNQTFQIIDGPRGWRLRAKHSGLCLDMERADQGNDVRLVQRQCSDSETQVWWPH